MYEFNHRCGLQGVEPGPGGKWSTAAAGIFQELLTQTVTLTVCEKLGDKFLVWLEDENGVDVATTISSAGLFH